MGSVSLKAGFLVLGMALQAPVWHVHVPGIHALANGEAMCLKREESQ